MQVWTTNARTALVGVFHVQGAHWSREQRRFVTHAALPPALSTRVGPSNVPALVQDHSAGMRYAMWSDALQNSRVVGLEEGMDVRLRHAQNDLITISRVVDAGGVSIAPLGASFHCQDNCRGSSMERGSREAAPSMVTFAPSSQSSANFA